MGRIDEIIDKILDYSYKILYSLILMDILNRNLTLVLNSIWQPIGYTSLKKAIVSMYSTQNGVDTAAKALDLEYGLDENGFIDFTEPTKLVPVGIPEWNELPIRDYDIPIHTSKKVVRAPIVLITNNFSKMIFRKLKPTKRNLFDFYGGRCIWTGKILSFAECSIEHMKPKSLGGDNSWRNLAPAQKYINNERGNTLIEDFKYKPKYKLSEPKAMSMSAMINKAARPEWQFFLINKK